MKGRGRGLPAERKAWANRADVQERALVAGEKEPPIKNPSAPKRFEDACAEIQRSIEKHVAGAVCVAGGDSSSEEEAENDSDVISAIFNLYGKSSPEMLKTEQALRDSLKNGAAVCLICIATIRRADPIWSCSKCYCSLHLTCIQRWAKDSIFFQTEAAADHLLPGQTVDPKKFNWCCPKCRAEYSQQVIPTRYFCYCQKNPDPRFDPWLVPHSCGSVCEKPLQPNCNHTCLLLCHPGPCPPCPKTVSVTCHCSKSAEEVRRCSSRAWSCGKKCATLLYCKEHYCEEICHAGPCPPCPRKSVQKCSCGAIEEERPCYSIDFQCEKVCGKLLDCSHHKCAVVCHAGKCGPCPLTLQRTCPCGKQPVSVACNMDVGGCGDTCGKLLECGVHQCAERCHKNKCGTCWQMSVKRCRCGVKNKELPCYKDFTCETKCKRIKDCRRHPCNHKCCTGECLPCDQLCNRTLACKNHKCVSRCHQGPCYPCAVTVQVSCACGKTTRTVPCGSERNTKPPRCSLPCRKRPDCHHAERTAHACHFGACPPCQQPCMKASERCGHICRAPCHTSVLVQVAAPQQQRAGPWEPKQAPRMEIKELPCPPCLVPVPVTCLGGHETTDWPCHSATPSSCFRPCGLPLTCTNHTCNKPCHAVSRGPQKNCELCEQVCSKSRPEGCNHPCAKGKCHAGPCPTCTIISKHSCHCGLNPQLIRCGELTLAITSDHPDAKEQLLSCKDRCPKLLSCRHRCPLSCHSGPCDPSQGCSSTVNVYCPCKRIKKSIPCKGLEREELQPIACNEACLKKVEQERKLKDEKERAQREEEERRNRFELEQFQRKFDKGRNSKDRRRVEAPVAQTARPICHYALGAAAVAVSAVMMALWWMGAWHGI